MTTPWGRTSDAFSAGQTHVPQDMYVTARAVGADLIAQLDPQLFEYGITDLNINGPLCRLFELHIGAIGPIPADSTTRTDSNTATYPTPKRVPPGSIVYGVWRTATGTATMTVRTVSY